MAPHPVLLPGKSHGRRSLVGCSPWGHEESDTTERLHFHFSLSRIGEGNGNLLQCSYLENPRDGGAWWAAVYGVTQSRTRLKQLSSSSSSQSLRLCTSTAGDVGLIPGWKTKIPHVGKKKKGNLHFSDIKYIHNVVQPLPPSISKTLSSCKSKTLSPLNTNSPSSLPQPLAPIIQLSVSMKLAPLGT